MSFLKHVCWALQYKKDKIRWISLIFTILSLTVKNQTWKSLPKIALHSTTQQCKIKTSFNRQLQQSVRTCPSCNVTWTRIDVFNLVYC